MKTLVCGSIALAALSLLACGQARAQRGLPEEVPHAPYNWTGPYFGASFGIATGSSKQSASTGDITPTFDMPGGVFGLALGYSWQFTRVLYGIETDMSLNTQRGTSGYIGAPAGFTAETSEQWLWTYRGRVAYVRDSWMIYLTGGGATVNSRIIATEPGAGIGSESRVRWGWTAGVGVEAARIHSFTVKAEYLYADFGNSSYFNPPPPGFINRAGGVRLYDHIFRLGLNHKFPSM